MKFQNSSGSQMPLYFQVTAMVDILMVLLVFFLYNYVVGQDEGQLKVTVPSAKHADTTPVSAPVFINVQKDGNVVVNGRSLTESELGNLLTDLIQNNPQQNVLLRADKDVAYERILRVLDICEGAKVEGVGFSATQIPAPSPSPSSEN
jgi:biopolymer transport protein ExbD